jgi:hypothetical protein
LVEKSNQTHNGAERAEIVAIGRSKWSWPLARSRAKPKKEHEKH